MKDLQRIRVNDVFTESVMEEVFTESVVEECRRKFNANVRDKVNRLLIEKAQELGLSLYEVCANYVPEINREIIEIDRYKEKREWPDMAIETTIRLVRRD